MRFRKPVLKVALDEGVPNDVGRVFQECGHKVIYLNKNDELPRGSKDQLVCAYAQINDAILIATDGDMKTLAMGHGFTKSNYRQLSLIKLSCFEPNAADRVKSAMSLIEHEWHVSPQTDKRRIFIEILDSVIRTTR